MERTEAISKLNKLIGTDLRALADRLNVPVRRPFEVAGQETTYGKTNKGWAGHTIERFLGLALNSSRSPNFGSWELKVVPVRIHPKRGVCVKETMAITMIDPVEVKAKAFEDSHLFNKLNKIVIVARTFESQAEERSIVKSVGTFDLDDPKIYAQVKADYDLVRRTLKTKGFDSLTGAMGVLVQPRTKGAGHGSTSRAFYARVQFVSHILGIKSCEL
jgi:DNA mismatch repair protein MutH